MHLTSGQPQKIARRLSRRMAQLETAAGHFEAGVRYNEPEVNLILQELFDDHVFARRLMIEWNFLERTADGSAYWLRAQLSIN